MYKIAVLPCDGIGPEVTAEALKVMDVAAQKFGVKYETVPYEIGGDRYLRTGDIITDAEMQELSQMDAIYLGAVGHDQVKPGILEHGILLRLRFEFDQYINLRPVKLYPGVPCPLKDKGPEDIDFVVVRENTEDMYAGIGGFLKKNTPDEVAVQEAVYTRKGCERVMRWAMELCRKRNKNKTIHSVDKANVLTYGHDLWRRTFAAVGEDYPDLTKEFAFVDACCMWFVKNPEWFDVIVTTNMFGDIITDLGAMIQGGMGVAASGNINPEGVSMFEPIHGSAPKHAGTGKASPVAAICAAGMMLEHLGEVEAGKAVENAVIQALGEGKVQAVTGDPGSCQKAGDIIAGLI
ncbi:MAG: 3-isopropylmalate dehydrogenase [Acidobacteriota bacterium]|jgi:3-isopropylmalate dehydrogenase|nr:3-isopropylmalate dehydrogenase [Acidobacteriota bacterium]